MTEPPVSIGISEVFNRLAYADSEEELIDAVRLITVELSSRVNRTCVSNQQMLFPATEETVVDSRKVVTDACVGSLDELINRGATFPTIYVDPPWPYKNKASRAAAENHYKTMSIDAIKSEPVARVARSNSHLHLWTTNGFLEESFDVMRAWGFAFKSCLVWVKPTIGMGNYWRVSHEFLLLGVPGRRTFVDRTCPSWLMADRSIHSRKPRVIRELIERVSQPPYLEMYGREAFPNSQWTVHGDQIEKQLF